MIKGFVLAIFLAAILAGLLNPLYSWLSKRFGGRTRLASILTVVICLVAGILPLLWFSGVVVSEAVQVSASAKEWLDTRGLLDADGTGFVDTLRDRLSAYPQLQNLIPTQEELIQKASEWTGRIGTWVAHALAASVSGTASFFLSLFIMLYGLGYFLVQGKAILEKALRYAPLTESDQDRLLGTFVSVARATLKGKLIVGIVQGGLAAFSFWLAGIEGVFFWFAIMTVLSVIPAVGVALVWVPVVIFLAMNGQMGAAIGVGLWCGLVVGLIDNVLTPILIGQDTEMPDLMVLTTTLGGLALFGIAGIVIGPIIGALFVAVWELLGNAIEEDRAGSSVVDSSGS